ncbi:MAG: tetratricopeptide repeat protein [Candidatus Omnitrophota bacterium]
MNNRYLPKFVISTVITLCVFCFAGMLFAQSKPADSTKEGISAEMREQAVKYRQAGLEYQRMGNLEMAMSLYQKAIVIDPGYGVTYNDLGVVYESEGLLQQAEENYLKAIKVDPSYLGAYANLALFYENQRKLDKAAFYWGQRATLGSPDDPWTQKAVSRLNEVRTALSNQPVAYGREDDVLGLLKDVSASKSVLNKDDKALALDHFRKAKLSFNKGDLAASFKEALDAQYLDQDNPEIEAFIEKTESRALSR